MPNGIIIIDKPADWTSHDVVAKCRRLLCERRIGHAGTLDPMATGVLPIFVGRATRAVEYAAEAGKEYVAGLQLGLATDTQDTTGVTLRTCDRVISRETLEAALSPFRGDILQIPPMYSALKKGGRPLYELARKGQEVERQPRPVTISALEILEQTGENRYLLRVACSKGTYIRTLCHDIGQALDCGGVMYSLRRTQAAGFTLAQAMSIDALTQAAEQGTAADLLMPVDSYFAQHPALTLQPAQERLCRNGNPFSCAGQNGLYRVYGCDGSFLMLGQLDEGTMTTIKSFYEV